MKRVVIANDHGAVTLTQALICHLKKKGYEVTYLGTSTTDAVDYPDQAEKACKEYLKGGYEFGIVLCGTGIGISISANKIDGIFCALPQNVYAAKMAKEHNKANFLAFGGRIEYGEPVTDILDSYLNAVTSEEERHVRRRAKMAALQK